MSNLITYEGAYYFSGTLHRSVVVEINERQARFDRNVAEVQDLQKGIDALKARIEVAPTNTPEEVLSAFKYNLQTMEVLEAQISKEILDGERILQNLRSRVENIQAIGEQFKEHAGDSIVLVLGDADSE